MAAIEAAFSIFSSSYPSTSLKFPPCPPSSHSMQKLYLCTSNLPLCIKSPLFPFSPLHLKPTKKPNFQFFSAVEDVVLEETTEQTHENNQKRKLFVLNLPWSFSVVQIKDLFAECGTVTDVEIIKHKDGKNRGFAFVTMASGEEAQAAIDKFDSYELSGRIIRVELARKFKKPSRAPPANPLHGETGHKLYLSNLAWKVRSSHLREFFSSFNPVSAKVVFDSPSGKSSGYGFVSFATKDQAEAALSAMDGKELLSRPVRLKFSEKSSVESEINMGETTEEQLEDP